MHVLYFHENSTKFHLKAMGLDTLTSYTGEVKEFKLSDIQVSERVQSSSEICQQTVATYAARMGEGKIQPVLVLFDGILYWLADGFHRYQAAQLLNRSNISCRVTHGSERDAILCAITANIDNGFKRANADKRKAVGKLLRDPEWNLWSNHEIARRCGVSHTFVRKLRLGLPDFSKNTLGKPRSTMNRIAFRKGREYPMDISNIGQLER